MVTANNMDLMTINQVEPIYVTFSVPEAQLPPSSAIWPGKLQYARSRRTR